MLYLYYIIPVLIACFVFTARWGKKLKPLLFLWLALFGSQYVCAQDNPVDTAKKTATPASKPIIKLRKTPIDSSGNNYGYLLNDDKEYNKTYPVWKPLVEVMGVNVFTWTMDRYILNESFSHIGPASWKYNLRKGWQWDDDRFGVNFIAHPYTGSMYFNAARSQGYGYFASMPFAASGSLMWEYFGEETRPSYNDIINTTMNGAFLGEIFYRLSSNILDDRATGADRAWREIFAGVVDPVRGLNRLFEGKSFRKTGKEVYQKEPLNITLFAGVHKINTDNNTVFGNGPTDVLFNVQVDYGNPFEDRSRKPFDYFKFRTEFSFGSSRKILDNVLGYGVLFGGNANIGKLSMLYGAFQYYDYWDNMTFELGALGFGGGVVARYPITNAITVYSTAHVAGIPLAGNSTRFGPDTSQVRDYTYNAGGEAKFTATINWGKYVTTSVEYYFYLLHAYVGPQSNNHISILKPRITVLLFKNVSAGFEHFIYYDDRYIKTLPAIYSVRTEQKIFLSMFLEGNQHKHDFEQR